MILSVSEIKKEFGIDTVLDGISFTVEDREKIGLIGNNGSGKTTLFNIISGEISKDDGEIHLQKNVKIGYLKQQFNLKDSSTVYEEALEVFSHVINLEKSLREMEQEISKNHDSENLDELLNTYASLEEEFKNQNGYGYHSAIRGVLKGIGFKDEEFNLKVENLSGGQKSRLSLGKLLLESPDLLLLDEPTNHLDLEASSWLEKFLREYPGAVIVISHDRYFLNNVVSKIFLLENHSLKIYRGDYNNYLKYRERELELLNKQYLDQQKEIKRQEEIIARFRSRGRDYFLKQGASRQKLLDKMKLVDAPTAHKTSNISFSVRMPSGEDVLRVEDLSKSYGSKTLFSGISFNVYRRDRIGLIGSNGIGKSTILKIIMRELEKSSGSIYYGSNLKIAYFDQELKSLNRENTIIDEMWDNYPKLNAYEIRSYLAKFLFFGDDVFKIIGDLSGGERARLALLILMLKGANLLLLDEPTNHLDIDSKEALEKALLNYDGTVLSISHDRYFLNRICNKLFVMESTKIDEYLGNYDYYLEKTKAEDEVEEEEISKTDLQNQKKLERKKRSEIRKLKADLKNLEEQIKNLEEELHEIDGELSDPSNYNDYEVIQKLSSRREEVGNLLDELYNSWIELNEE